MGVPDTVVEAELDLLFDVTWEIIRSHPAGVDVESRFALVGMRVDHLQLHRIPGVAVCRTNETALPCGVDPREPPPRAKREVDELDVMHRDIGAGITAGDPLSELAAANLFRFQQGAIPVVDV